MSMHSTHSPLNHTEPRGIMHGPNWKWTLALGIILIIGGIACFLNPFAASLTAVAVASIAFIIAGAVQLWIAFQASSDTPLRLVSGLLGLLILAFGVSLMANPLAGLLSLTFLVALFFMILGAVRAGLAFSVRPVTGWAWLAAAGAVSFGLGLLIVIALPEAATGLLGLFLGVDLLSSGIGATALALHNRH